MPSTPPRCWQQAPLSADGRVLDELSGRTGPPAPRTGRRRLLPVLLLLASLALTAWVTMRPVGDGWAWGAPAEELRWYLAGLGSPATLRQLLGNLLLLTPATVAAVVCVPRLGRARLLVVAAVTAAAIIEGLQWLLPLGRVVSPTDGVLNASGAVLAGLLTVHVLRRTSPSEGNPTGDL